jgi:hypothetical protein
MEYTQPLSSIGSRINVVSVVAGVMLTLAIMFFSMSLAAALGFWSYRPDELPLLGPKFWTVASIAWTVSVFVGSVWATMSSRSTEMKNGVLNAVTAWAGSYLLFGGIALTIADSNLRTLLGSPTIGLFWHGFIGDAIALIAGIVGGVLGTYAERGTLRVRAPKADQKSSTGVTSKFDEMNSAKV